MKDLLNHTSNFEVEFKSLMTAAMIAQQIFNFSLKRPKPYEPLSQVTILNYAKKLTLSASLVIQDYFAQTASDEFLMETTGYGACGNLAKIAQNSGIPETHWDNLYLNRVFPSGLFIFVKRNGEVWLEDKARQIRNKDGFLVKQTWINVKSADLTTLIDVCLFAASSGFEKISEVLSQIQNPVAQYLRKNFFSN